MRLRMFVLPLLFCLVFTLIPPQVWAGEGGLAPQARSAILLDADSGTVLYQKNIDEKLSPASITKIMTMLLVMEALEQGKVSYNDKVRISEHAASMGGSQIFLEPGEQMEVKDLLKGVAIGSANDASVALAEHLAGTEEAFIERMNQRAKELGMTHTRFQNPNGLPAPDHYTTARDIAIMSRELLKYPEITKYTRIYQDYLRQDSNKPFWLVNTNRLVRFYEGMDGLKTGFTAAAKYCLSATAKRGNFRVIAVVLGEPTSKARNREISRMLDYAFSQYTNHVVYKKGDPIGTVRLDKGEERDLLIRAPHQFSVLIKKGENHKDYTRKVVLTARLAPVKKGQTIGEVLLEKQGKRIAEMKLAAPRDVQRAGLWTLMKRTTKSFFFFPEEAKALEQPAS
ncbi:D-alanyl-D-alanine carboxypeptidase DacF [Marinithermofilum abyssi]|uniref:serine-type D-Ala-D-Ala carboxypeptidase n=1 Tax=Marinithermofilum abyssi TaxID=1571185 RepID=A0A8J2VCL8_9BACL|nr:D-alanyl-D-alanine carboxypeptidase family protein [Marinithermofilum abyssi]GGE10825.1 D-alanyl-D-alanine carboxypeptidase DacF [Marinithermofilum abyssi]